VTVDRIERREEAYVLSMTADGRRRRWRRTWWSWPPRYAAAKMLAPWTGAVQSARRDPYSPITVAALGYEKATLGTPSTDSAS